MILKTRSYAQNSNLANFSSPLSTQPTSREIGPDLPNGPWWQGIFLAWRIWKRSLWPSSEPITMSIPLRVLKERPLSWRLLSLALTSRLAGWSRPRVISSVSDFLTCLATDVHLVLKTSESPAYLIGYKLLDRILSYLIGGGFITTITLSLTKPRYGIPASLESCSTRTRPMISSTLPENLLHPRFVVTGKRGRTIEITKHLSAASTLMLLSEFD